MDIDSTEQPHPLAPAAEQDTGLTREYKYTQTYVQHRSLQQLGSDTVIHSKSKNARPLGLMSLVQKVTRGAASSDDFHTSALQQTALLGEVWEGPWKGLVVPRESSVWVPSRHCVPAPPRGFWTLDGLSSPLRSLEVAPG